MLNVEEVYDGVALSPPMGSRSEPAHGEQAHAPPAKPAKDKRAKTRGRAAKRAPKEEPVLSPPVQEPDGPVEIPKPGRTILIVEDHADMLESIQTLLELSIPNVRILVAPNAEEGLRILAAESVQLIVSDYQMPGMDGVAFLREAREIVPNVARVLLTAHPRTAVTAPEAAEAGVHELLIKPMSSEALVRSIKEIFRRKSRDELVPVDRSRLFERAENAVR